jgi:hypothetical protein
MDFSTRGSQSPAAPRPSSSFQAETGSGKSSKHEGKQPNKLTMVGKLFLLVAVAVMVLAVLALLIFPNTKSEKSYVDGSKLQAVFLTNDQVYFGKITDLNSKFLVLNNIYYLRTQDTGAKTNNGNVSLVKLGCELHKPYDRMVINRSQVQFWENLQSDGQVAQAVASYVKTNPNNTCSNTASNGASGSDVQGTNSNATSNTTNTNSSTNTSSNSNSSSKNSSSTKNP